MKSKINFLAIVFSLFSSVGFAATSDLATSAACPLAFPKAGLCASAQWVQGPSANVENQMLVQFYDAKTLAPKDPTGAVTVVLFMPDMGHGSSPTSLKHNAEGIFEVRKMFFIMEGQWEVRVAIDGEQQVLPVDIQ